MRYYAAREPFGCAVRVESDLPRAIADWVGSFVGQMRFADGDFLTLVPGWQCWSFQLVDDNVLDLRLRRLVRLVGELPLKLCPMSALPDPEADGEGSNENEPAVDALALPWITRANQQVLSEVYAAIREYNKPDKAIDPSQYFESAVAWWTSTPDASASVGQTRFTEKTAKRVLTTTLKIKRNVYVPRYQDLGTKSGDGGQNGVPPLTGWKFDLSEVSTTRKLLALAGGVGLIDAFSGDTSTKSQTANTNAQTKE